MNNTETESLIEYTQTGLMSGKSTDELKASLREIHNVSLYESNRLISRGKSNLRKDYFKKQISI